MREMVDLVEREDTEAIWDEIESIQRLLGLGAITDLINETPKRRDPGRDRAFVCLDYTIHDPS